MAQLTIDGALISRTEFSINPLVVFVISIELNTKYKNLIINYYFYYKCLSDLLQVLHFNILQTNFDRFWKCDRIFLQQNFPRCADNPMRRELI